MLIKNKELFAILESIVGRKININQFDDRLTIQKLTYILKELGVNFNYRFNWYWRGPYSPSLAHDAFNFYQNFDGNSSHISAKNQEIVEKTKNIFSKDIKKAGKLEIIASLLYQKEEKDLSLSDTTLISLLKSLKPWLSEKEIETTATKLIKSKEFE